jgi:hydrogenase nickel incorporation protein HypA/HybF
MHELAVTQALLDLVIERSDAVQATRVTDIYIEVGQLSSYVDDSVQFYWDIISRGTRAEGASLHFKRIALEMQCTACGARFLPDSESFACPQCGSDQVLVTAGDVFCLTGLDVERGAQTMALEAET